LVVEVGDVGGRSAGTLGRAGSLSGLLSGGASRGGNGSTWHVHGHSLGRNGSSSAGSTTGSSGHLLGLAHHGVVGSRSGVRTGHRLAGSVGHGHRLGNGSLGSVTSLGVRRARSRTGLAHGHHARLGEGHSTSTRGHEVRGLSGAVEHGLSGDTVSLGRKSTLGSSLLHTDLVAGLDGSLKLGLADILALGQGDVQGLAVKHALVHLSDGLGGLVGGREADESESLGLSETLLLLLLVVRGLLTLLLLLSLLGLLLLGLLAVVLLNVVTHDLSRSDGSVRSKLLAKTLIINLVVQVLDVPMEKLDGSCQT
jgi:hypothetical protein